MTTTSDTRQEPGFSSAATRPLPQRRRPPPFVPLWMVVAGVLLAAGVLYALLRPEHPVTAPAPAPQPQAAAPAEAAPPAEPPLALAPAADALAPSAIEPALVQLLGAQALRFLQLTDFPSRFVATVDNLGREQAPVLKWPVRPMDGRFTVEDRGQGQVIAAANAQRYAPFVAFATSVDAAQAVALYQRMHPALQQAWRELGFADRSLHQRVLAVVALLLATPRPASPPQLSLLEVKGPVPSSRPWTRYEFTDPALQRLPAGQKILLRLAPAQRQALEAKLRELQAELLKVSVPASR